MASIRRILCPLDLERSAASVLHCAASLATTFGATLEALHVRSSAKHAPWTMFQSPTQVVEALMAAHAAEQQLSDIVAGANANVRVSKKVLDGTTTATILAEVESADADLLVVGTSAPTAWWQKRSTGSEVSSKARCAVLTVPMNAPATFARRILLPVDFSAATEVALEWTILLARSFGSHVDVLHALPAEAAGPHAAVSSLKRPRLTRALTRLATTVARLREAGVSDTTSVVVEGDTLDAILARNDSESSSLIVMGSHAVTPALRDSDTATGTIAWVRASLTVPVLSVRSPPLSAEWESQELPRRASRNRGPDAHESAAARSA
jgi:nucleotide-binding universal stress UspA family protein